MKTPKAETKPGIDVRELFTKSDKEANTDVIVATATESSAPWVAKLHSMTSSAGHAAKAMRDATETMLPNKKNSGGSAGS